jgi:hypothetical protein
MKARLIIFVLAMLFLLLAIWSVRPDRGQSTAEMVFLGYTNSGGVPPRRTNEIVKGQRAITADTALRLWRYFKMSAEFWLNLQSHYDLEQEQERLGKKLDREVKVLAAA